jgi:hypothetical protein
MKNATGTLQILDVAFGEQIMALTHGFECFSTFNSRVTAVEEAEHLGHPSARKRITMWKELVLETFESLSVNFLTCW